MDNTLDYQVYMCDVCHYLYNEANGEPLQGILPKTRVEDFPEDWKCPYCGAGKLMLRCCQDVDGFVS